MAQCEECLHYAICEIMHDQYGISKIYPSQCGYYRNAADVAPKSEWISVEDRLPEDDLPKEHKKKTIKVIVAIKAKNGITIRTQERFLDYTYSNGGERKSYWHWRFSHGEVTHWMPLPEPPKMKGGEE